jgi:hypothetical protein
VFGVWLILEMVPSSALELDVQQSLIKPAMKLKLDEDETIDDIAKL